MLSVQFIESHLVCLVLFGRGHHLYRASVGVELQGCYNSPLGTIFGPHSLSIQAVSVVYIGAGCTLNPIMVITII